MKLGTVVVTALLGGCGMKTLPPPAVPAKTLPVPIVRLGPPPVGAGSVLIDADQPNVVVHEIVGTVQTVAVGTRGGMAYGTGIATERLCITPCQVHLRQGLHQVMFESPTTGWGGVADLQVGVEPSAYRYALGHRDLHVGARLGAAMSIAFGFTALLGGGIWYLASDTYQNVGGGIAIGGGALFALGVAIAIAVSPEERNGSGVQWTPEGPAPVTPPE